MSSNGENTLYTQVYNYDWTYGLQNSQEVGLTNITTESVHEFSDMVKYIQEAWIGSVWLKLYIRLPPVKSLLKNSELYGYQRQSTILATVLPTVLLANTVCLPCELQPHCAELIHIQTGYIYLPVPSEPVAARTYITRVPPWRRCRQSDTIFEPPPWRPHRQFDTTLNLPPWQIPRYRWHMRVTEPHRTHLQRHPQWYKLQPPHTLEHRNPILGAGSRSPKWFGYGGCWSRIYSCALLSP